MEVPREEKAGWEEAVQRPGGWGGQKAKFTETLSSPTLAEEVFLESDCFVPQEELFSFHLPLPENF